jgi:hypothetical protein
MRKIDKPKDNAENARVTMADRWETEAITKALQRKRKDEYGLSRLGMSSKSQLIEMING